jgi:hypothetical protein
MTPVKIYSGENKNDKNKYFYTNGKKPAKIAFLCENTCFELFCSFWNMF